MKKIVIALTCLLLFSMVYGADVNVTLTIPETHVPKIVEMLDAKYPKLDGETTKQQFKRFLVIIIKNRLEQFEKIRDMNNAANNVNIPLDIIQ